MPLDKCKRGRGDCGDMTSSWLATQQRTRPGQWPKQCHGSPRNRRGDYKMDTQALFSTQGTSYGDQQGDKVGKDGASSSTSAALTRRICRGRKLKTKRLVFNAGAGAPRQVHAAERPLRLLSQKPCPLSMAAGQKTCPTDVGGCMRR